MTNKIKPFRSFHIIGETSIEGMDGEFQKKQALLFQFTDSYSLFVNDNFVMAGGAVDKTESIGFVWLFITEKIKKHMKDCVKCVRFFVKELLKKYTALEVLVKKDSATLIRFAKKFGFSETGDFESIMGEKYAVLRIEK